MLNAKDEKDMIEISQYVSKGRNEMLGLGFAKIPKEGMKRNRQKIIAMKGKKVNGKLIKSQHIMEAIAIYSIIVENTYQENLDITNWKDGCMFWSITSIANEAGSTRKTVAPLIDLLVEAEVLIRLYRYNQTTNEKQYFFYPVFIGDEKVKYQSERKLNPSEETTSNEEKQVPERTESSDKALEDAVNMLSHEEIKTQPEANMEEANTFEDDLEMTQEEWDRYFENFGSGEEIF